MKKLILITLFSPILLCGQTWERTFGGEKYESGNSVLQSSDGGFVVAGSSCGSGDFSSVYLLKTDVYGDTLWTKTYWDWGTNHDWGYSVQQTTDGGYIITGENTSFAGTGQRYACLIKTDNFGDMSWIKMYGGFGQSVKGYSVQQTTDGGYVITGSIYTIENGLDVYLIKTNSYGDISWTKSFGRCDNEIGYSVQQTSDNGFIIAGVTNSCNSDTIRSHVYLIKTDDAGDTLWTKIFHKNDYDVGRSVVQTADGGYIIAGKTTSWWGEDIYDVYLIKTDSDGDTIWTKVLGGESNDEARSVQQTIDGGYIITGASDITGSGWNTLDVFLLKIDNNGDTIWSEIFGGDGVDFGKSVQQTTDGGYIVSGTTSSYSSSDDIYLIKTNENGIITFVSEVSDNDPKRKLIKMVDLVGREISNPKINQTYIEIYDDGTIEKKMKLK